jgi:hypothetical protein
MGQYCPCCTLKTRRTAKCFTDQKPSIGISRTLVCSLTNIVASSSQQELRKVVSRALQRPTSASQVRGRVTGFPTEQPSGLHSRAFEPKIWGTRAPREKEISALNRPLPQSAPRPRLPNYTSRASTLRARRELFDICISGHQALKVPVPVGA